MTAPRKLFVNLPISDLPRSVAFFTKLGFTFNPMFTDENATCMIFADDAYAMLLVTKRFADFAKKPIADGKTTECINAFSVDSRAEVDQVCDAALAGGGAAAGDTQDLGFMYSRSFYDLDGHHWECLYMDMSQVPKS